MQRSEEEGMDIEKRAQILLDVYLNTPDDDDDDDEEGSAARRDAKWFPSAAGDGPDSQRPRVTTRRSSRVAAGTLSQQFRNMLEAKQKDSHTAAETGSQRFQTPKEANQKDSPVATAADTNFQQSRITNEEKQKGIKHLQSASMKSILRTVKFMQALPKNADFFETTQLPYLCYIFASRLLWYQQGRAPGELDRFLESTTERYNTLKASSASSASASSPAVSNLPPLPYDETKDDTFYDVIYGILLIHIMHNDDDAVLSNVDLAQIGSAFTRGEERVAADRFLEGVSDWRMAPAVPISPQGIQDPKALGSALRDAMKIWLLKKDSACFFDVLTSQLKLRVV